MSEEIKPEPKKDVLDEATLDQVSGGLAKEEFRVAPHKDILKR